MNIEGRVIFRNRALCDGTPRRESGFRAVVETIGPEYLMRRFHISPLFPREADAAAWLPDGVAA